jgi:hypothetical protein
VDGRPDVGETSSFESRGSALDRRDGRTLAPVHRTGGPICRTGRSGDDGRAALGADALAGGLCANYARGTTLYADLLRDSVEVTIVETKLGNAKARLPPSGGAPGLTSPS